MQIATCWVALGGDTGNTVPKFDVTPAEIAVLQLIHGSDAVFDISPGPDVNRSNRDERSRLQAFYGKPEGSREPSAVNVLFPGIGARLPETFDELEIDESFFKATERATTKSVSGHTSAPSKGATVNQVDEDAEIDEDAVDEVQTDADAETKALEKKTGKKSAVDKRPAGGKAKRSATGDPAKVIEPVAHSHRDEAVLEDDPAAKAKQPKVDPASNTVTNVDNPDIDDGIDDMDDDVDKGIFK